ncbi:MAG: hypothetical protein ACLFUJ_02980 [Phycisphaerae bacterium]
MPTDFTFTGQPAATATADPVYQGCFDAPIVYENRNCIHTSRWSLTGVDTRPSGNLARGWLWMTAETIGSDVSVRLFADPSGDLLVAAGSASQSSAPVRLQLNPANGSGLNGELFIERYLAAQTAAPVLVSLCVDEHLAEYWADLAELPADLYSPWAGMARHCAAATRRTLLLVSQLYQAQLGGFGPREDRRLAGAGRAAPDYRRIAVPEQLTAAAACWALELALGSKHQRSEQTMYSQLRDHFARQRQQAIAQWQLTFNTNPDADGQADLTAGGRVTRPIRL